MPGHDGDGVTILMGLFNGARFLDDQLASIAAQDHANWSLIISDDGSDDSGPEQVCRFADKVGADRVTLLDGPRAGFSQNFLSLLEQPRAGGGGDVALCDQDDCWLPFRLSRGLAALRALGDGPALYCGRTNVCDQNLKLLHVSPLWPKPFGMRNALVQNVASGNTILLNRAMADLARAAAPAARRAKIAAHDWWLYQLACATGARIVQDDTPVLHYRQHGSNSMGRNDTLTARLGRIAQITDGTFARWIDANAAALTGADLPLTNDASTLLQRLADLRSDGLIARLRALRQMGLYRQETIGNVALLAAAAAKRL